MPDTPSPSSRQSFPDDLRRIREKRGLTLEALHEETKIPLNVLEEFEETGLFENPMFNRVYLRSLVRTYASYVDIPSKVMLEALDEALLNSYKGRLAVQYLGEPPPQPEAKAVSEPTASAAPAVTADSPAPEAAPPEAPEPDAPEAEEPVAAAPEAEAAAAEPPASEEAAEAPEEPAEAAPPTQSHPRLLKNPGTSWAAQSPGPRGRRRPLDVKRRASYTQWVLIVGVVVIFAGVIWALLSFLDRSTETDDQQAALADTAAVETAPPPPPRPRLVLGDTLDVVVVAVQKVERIHIKRDEDARRPYWIEEGVAKVFPALERIIFEDRLDRIRLLVEGFEYPTDRRDDQDRIVITRADLQAFADTLTVLPVSLPVAPDTIPMMPVRAR